MESTRTECEDRVEYKNEQGQYHREDGPAIIFVDGSKFWCLNDKQYSKQDYNEEMLKIRLQRLMEL